MVVVAVSGGTGGLGRTIVEAILATGKHEVKILSRKADPEKEAQLGAPVVAVDYDNVAAITEVLEQQKIHTLISTLQMMDNAGGPVEPRLIAAADASKATKRMISSEWGVDIPISQKDKLPSVAPKCAAFDALKETKNLEWTVVHNGYFMDYYGMPNFKSNMTRFTMILDVENDAAAIPGSGNVPVAFTHTSDVAKVVAGMLDLDGWENRTTIVGDKLTWNEATQLAQEIKGTKFTVAYDDMDKLRAGSVTELPSHVAAYAFFPKAAFQFLVSVFGAWFEEGVFNIDETKSVTKRLPHVKTMTMRDLLEAAWKKQ